jgi:hypothetical protein
MASTQNQKTSSGGSAAGSLSARLLGPPVFAAWCVITSDFQPRLLACIWSPLLV